MTAADLSYVVAAAPWTALLSAFTVGALCVLTAVGALAAIRRLTRGRHEDRCASCALAMSETVPLPASVFAVAESSGVVVGGE